MSNTDPSARSQSTKTPEWATEAFKDFLEYAENLERVLLLSMQGISMIRAVPNAIEVLAEVDPHTGNGDHKQRLDSAREAAAFAQKEVHNGFPLLHAQAAVSLWGSLEALIKVFLTRWLTNEPGAMLIPKIQKLKVQIGEYNPLDDEERRYLVVELLERDMEPRLKIGMSRFENLLEMFELGGTVAKDVTRNLLELNQVRNAIAHRRGLVDRRLLAACPWLSLQIGDPVTITHRDYKRYSDAVISYVSELIVRVRVHFGMSREDFADILVGPGKAPKNDA